MSTVRVALRWGLAASAFAAGAVAVAACQGLAGQPRDAAAGFMASSDYGLHYVDLGDSAKLAYGKEDSEVIGLMLECGKGSGAVEISDVARGAGSLSLRSGGQRSEFAGSIAPSPMAPIVVAQGKTSAPALQGFRQTGRMQVTNGGLTYDVAAKAGERVSVERFFAACEQTA